MRSDQLLAHDIFASIDQTLAKVIGIISIKVKHKMQIFLGVAVIAIFLQFSPGETAFHNCTRPGLVALTFGKISFISWCQCVVIAFAN